MQIVGEPGGRGKAIAKQTGGTTPEAAMGVKEMQAGIRVIKRGAQSGRSELSADHVAKSDRERERETVNTVKAWVADWERRRCSLRIAADAILCSIGDHRERQTKRFAIVN